MVDLQADVERMVAAFRGGRRLYLAVRNEEASNMYTTDFLARLFEQEGHEVFDVRQAVLGHLQQGGAPSPFDRLLATRLVKAAIDDITAQLAAGTAEGHYLGDLAGHISFRPLAHFDEDVDRVNRRPREQWWLELRPAVAAVAEPEARSGEATIPVLDAQVT